jgi:hypothetical protein
MTTESREKGPLDGFAMVLFWGGILAGLILPGISLMLAKRRSPTMVLADYWQSYTGAEPGLVILTALHTAPFLAFAVFCLLHLGKAPAHDTVLSARRLSGALVAGLLMLAVSLWGNISIFASRSSTAPIGFIFLPFYLAIAGALGYGLGRVLIARLRRV